MMKNIFNTFITTLPSMVNIGGLMILIIFIYSVIGVSLFATVRMQAPMNDHLNFRNVGNSFLTLIRVATGENWNHLLNTVGMDYNLRN